MVDYFSQLTKLFGKEKQEERKKTSEELVEVDEIHTGEEIFDNEFL